MTPDELDEQIRDLLDEEIARHSDGTKTSEVEAAILDQVEKLITRVKVDKRARAEEAIHRVATTMRRSRRAKLRESVDYVLDGLTAPEDDGAYVDPLLRLAFPVGTTDGEVKTLRFWSVDDFRTSVQMTYRKAADTTRSAQQWDLTAERAVAYMTAQSLPMLGGSGEGAES